uniref:glutamyl aminopeptidase n=1 Tax=Ciona intestinalis TaxID=7719 RepID=UPI000180C033|nr:glutamyl aminopeptidase [Ciona intestinalis]|eukprot:XP_009860488.1 glutamyl aminopeptidase [Ciona intestinalis]
MSTNFDLESSQKSKGCPRWQVFVICAALIGIGLGVGLGVGLSNQNKATVIVTTDPPKVTTSTKAPVTTTTAADLGTGPWQNYRLPEYITPSHYRLTLHPNMTTDTYTGTNAMTFTVSQPTKYVLVHADAQVAIHKVTLEHVVGGATTYHGLKIVREFRYPEFEYYVVETDTMLTVLGDNENYVLTMEFSSSLVLRIVGLYKSTYTVPGTGEEKAMVGSDMEPTDARKAYPCFDEPAFKIRFTTTLVHEAHHNALSNMDVDKVVDRSDGLTETLFKESVPMSTYLGCFAVSEFVSLEEKSAKNGIPLRVFVPPHQKDAGQANYALDVMKIVFDFFEEYFGMDYALPKCDMISIPNFGTGAMENWGLITYRETNLLWDDRESSTANKQRVAAVIAHELVHQWFGNVVTMKWWDNLWLNEGFASYFEYLGQQVAEPTWQIMDQFLIQDIQPVLSFDSRINSHPIVVNVSTPGQITSVFDTISYSKGASILRYMREILGEEAFMGGIRNYLRKHEYANADHHELWRDVQEYIDDSTSLTINIADTMNPWVEQMGYPVLSVANDGTVTQDHFLIDPNADLSGREPSAFNYKWNVDLAYYTSNDPTITKERLAINAPSKQLAIGTLNPNDYFKLNPGQQGYYRVNYEVSMWNTISQQLLNDHTVFNETDRSNLMDDALTLAPAKKITYPQALNMTRYLDNERGYLVWDAFSSGSSYIRIMLESTLIYPDFQAYYRNKVKPAADELGWNASVGTHVEKLNRALCLGLALRYGDVDALANATDFFSQWIADSSYYLYPDTRQLVYRYGIADTGVAEWETMLQRYLVESVATERTNLMRGLTSTEDVTLISRMLEYSKNESIVRTQDFFNWITYISYSTTGNRMAWAWVQLNWEYMVARFGINDRNLGRLVPNIVSDYNTDVQLWEVESFFARYPESGAGASGRISAVNEINTNIQWMKENQAVIADWLATELGN